jgi:hypothetical protein
MISTKVRTRRGEVFTVAAMPTRCPQLMVVAEMRYREDGRGADQARFTGGFTVLHAPTGALLQARDGSPLTVEIAEFAAALVSDLDWNFTDIAQFGGGLYIRRWAEALADAEELMPECVDPDEPDVVARDIADVLADRGLVGLD